MTLTSQGSERGKTPPASRRSPGYLLIKRWDDFFIGFIGGSVAIGIMILAVIFLNYIIWGPY